MSYESMEETNTRLSSTVVMYKGQPVMCEGAMDMIGTMPVIRVIFLPDARQNATVRLDDPDLEIKRFNIGYMNIHDGASYAMRVPCRGHYKQGLCRENLQLSPTAPNRHRPEFQAATRSSGFRDMLLGVYPNFEEALKILETDRTMASVAFEQNFAISQDEFRKDYLLHYKGSRVGFGIEGFQIPEEFRYLREVITKSGIKMR